MNIATIEHLIYAEGMDSASNHDERMAKMTFATVYPHYVTKVVKKGRTKEELHHVIEWLTGYDEKKQQQLIDEKVTFETFLDRKSTRLNSSHVKISYAVFC